VEARRVRRDGREQEAGFTSLLSARVGVGKERAIVETAGAEVMEECECARGEQLHLIPFRHK
jgi:hypothetical protein